MDGRMTDEPKYCAACGKLLVRRLDEPPYRWRQRRTCDKACGTSYGGQKGQGGRVEAWVDWTGEAMHIDGDKLKTFIDQIEGLHGQCEVLRRSMTDTFRDAKRQGFDPNTMRLVMKRRRNGPEATEYSDAQLDAYEDALSRAHAHGHAPGTSREEAIVTRPFQLSEFIQPADKQRLMAGR